MVLPAITLIPPQSARFFVPFDRFVPMLVVVMGLLQVAVCRFSSFNAVGYRCPNKDLTMT